MALYDQVKSQRESLKAQVRAAIDADDLEAVRALFVDASAVGAKSLTGMQTAGDPKALDDSGDNRPPPHG